MTTTFPDLESLEPRTLMSALPDLQLTRLRVLPATAEYGVRCQYVVKNRGQAAARLRGVVLQPQLNARPAYDEHGFHIVGISSVLTGRRLPPGRAVRGVLEFNAEYVNNSVAVTPGIGLAVQGVLEFNADYDPSVYRYLAAKIDATDRVRESNEDNNARVAVLPATLGDAYEDDNTPTTAKVVPTDGSVQQRTVHAPGDVDWAKFTLAARSRVTITTTVVGDGDNEMWLYGPDSSTRELEYNDDGDHTEDYAAGIIRDLDAGTYFLKIQELDNDELLQRYALSVDAEALDDVDPPDVLGDWYIDLRHNDGAGWVADLHITSQEPNAAGGDDIRGYTDWTRLDRAGSGREIFHGTVDDDGRLEIIVDRLENATWNTPNRYVGTVNDAGAVIANGTYFKVNSNTLEGRWSASRTRPIAADSFESDNAAAQAKVVTPNAPAQSRTIHTVGDVDWAKFTLTARSNVVIETNGVSGGDNEMWLYGPDSSTAQIEYDNNDGTGNYAKITRTLDPGTYYVKTQEYGNNATLSSYTLAVQATLDPTLITGAWNLTGTQTSGEQWRATMTFTKATAAVGGALNVEGHTDWTRIGAAGSGREYFRGTLAASGVLEVSVHRLENASWSNLNTYRAQLNSAGTQLANGTWNRQGNAAVAGRWTASRAATPTFALTSTDYDLDADLDAMVQQSLGAAYRMADWTDLLAAWEQGDINDVLAMLGGRRAWVSRNGTDFYSSTRRYFVNPSLHQTPSGFLVHDHLDNHLIDLGSWWGPRPILAVRR